MAGVVMSSSIYALCEPDMSEIRYVGHTVNIEGRLWGHVRESIKGRKTHKCCWIRRVLREGKEPLLVILHSNIPSEIAPTVEQVWIQKCRLLGHDLTNETDGGEGALGHIPTEETRQKISAILKGRPHSPEWCENISKGRTGVKVSPEGRASISKGHRGKPWSPAQRVAYKNRVPWNKGKKGLQVAWNKGKKFPKEAA